MEELAKFFASWTPGSYGVWTGVIMLAGWMAREWRETKKLSLEDREARRLGYSQQVAALQTENREQREEISRIRKDADEREARQRKEYDDYRHLCQAETDALRNTIMRLEGELTGVKRMVAAQGIEAAKLIPGTEDLIARVERARGG